MCTLVASFLVVLCSKISSYCRSKLSFNIKSITSMDIKLALTQFYLRIGLAHTVLIKSNNCLARCISFLSRLVSQVSSLKSQERQVSIETSRVSFLEHETRHVSLIFYAIDLPACAESRKSFLLHKIKCLFASAVIAEQTNVGNWFPVNENSYPDWNIGTQGVVIFLWTERFQR